MNMIRRNLIAGLGIFFFLGLCGRVDAQVYSQNIVGYYNLLIRPGDNFIANQLDNSGGNTLTNLFQSGVPQGATFTKWDANLVQFLPLSTYDSSSGWSINYDLTFGEGGKLTTSTTFTNVFFGTVGPSLNTSDSGPLFFPPLISGNGLFLLSCVVPINSAGFFDVVGRNPEDGDYVKIWDSISQTENTTTFGGGLWDHGAPSLSVGQSAFFGLGGMSPSPVPEPSIYGLFGAGLLMLWKFRPRK